ncbi:MAG: hypothetical protein IKW93_06155 [Bacteroidales bacterium]|nr:hypothetical protein [Bacteroidales bacterium]
MELGGYLHYCREGSVFQQIIDFFCGGGGMTCGLRQACWDLDEDYGTEYGRRNLAYYRQFYLTWTHIRRILSVSNPDAQLWYLKAASGSMWGVLRSLTAA